MKHDAEIIIKKTIADVMPQKAVSEQLAKLKLDGRIFVISIGKAAWTMAAAASEMLKEQIEAGIVITKYDHVMGELSGFEIIEAGHPIPDQNSVLGAERAITLLKKVAAQDTVLFLLSGGGSALFEFPKEGVTLDEIQDVTGQLLSSGAGIQEINIIRKKLSKVKGGKLMTYIGEAKAYSVILSDVLGNHDDMIASGLTYPDTATSEDALIIIEKYQMDLPEHIKKILTEAQPCLEEKVQNHIVGSVHRLCLAAAEHARELGYHTEILTDNLTCEAREAGSWLATMAKKKHDKRAAYIAGGETVVKVKGSGLGGRNQEIAVSAAIELNGINNALLLSLGSDGTDGPTDAAGGMADGRTYSRLKELGIECWQVLENNDAYHALEKVGGLIKTGPTGTNVNDVTVLLCRPSM